MKLHELRPAAGSKKAPKRVGRGTGSGLGRNAGKGEKGQLLLETRVISKVLDGVKILGNGTIDKSLTVQGCKFSKSAAEKIEAAGGKVEVI